MGGIAEMAIGWLFRRADEWLAGTNGNGNGSPGWAPAVKYQDDDGGRRLSITVPRGGGEGNHAGVLLNSSSGVYVKAVGEYADEAGDFIQSGAFDGDTCLLYVPFSALSYPRAGEYTLKVVLLGPGTVKQPLVSLGCWYFKFPLPSPARWNKLAHLSPLIDLCMMMVRAGGGAVPEKVRQMKASFAELFGFTPTEVAELRGAMKGAKTGEIALLAERVWFRFSRLKTVGLLGLLAGIAKSDGDLTAAELSIIRETALTIGVEESDWPSCMEYFDLVLDDPWETLGVSQGASLCEIKSAYRRKINEYHPDRYAGAPRELQELATKLTVNVQHSYERLKKRCASVGVDGADTRS